MKLPSLRAVRPKYHLHIYRRWIGSQLGSFFVLCGKDFNEYLGLSWHYKRFPIDASTFVCKKSLEWAPNWWLIDYLSLIDASNRKKRSRVFVGVHICMLDRWTIIKWVQITHGTFPLFIVAFLWSTQNTFTYVSTVLLVFPCTVGIDLITKL